jgi:hypothetical protein
MFKKPKFYLLLLHLIAINSIISCTQPEKWHIGEWQMEDKNRLVSFIFKEDQTAVLVRGNQVYGGDGFFIEENLYQLKYEIDYTKNPVWLDFVVLNGESKEINRLRGILRFLTENKLEFRLNFDDPQVRYQNFDPNDVQNTGVLERRK